MLSLVLAAALAVWLRTRRMWRLPFGDRWLAGSPHGPWRLANSPALSYALPIAYFDSLGLARLFAGDAQPSEPPDADPHVLGGVAGVNR